MVWDCGKLRRIGLPWLYWCGIYAVFVVLLALRNNEPISDVFEPLMVLYGPMIFLWFGPFIVMADVLSAGLHRLTRGHTSYWKFGSTMLIATGILLVVNLGESLHGIDFGNLPMPFWQWYFASPTVLFGLAMGQALLLSRKNPRWMDALALVTALAAVGSIVYLETYPPFRRYMVSFTVIALTFAVGRRVPNRNRFTEVFSPMMLGVYFIHEIFVYIVYMPLHNLGLLYPVVVYMVSLGAVAILRKTRLRVLV
jgi:surface polysaccharide O-acyltransferase-like enzyme